VGGYVAREGWQVLKASDGESALDVARKQRPDVVVLDLMLPKLDGLEVCRQLRAFSDAYVLMLTARGEEIDRIVGLSVGADDYLVKPFSPRELIARIKAMTRRPRGSGPASELPDGLEIDESRRVVQVDGAHVELSALEFDLLAELCRDPGTVLRRQVLLDRVWGPDVIADSHLVDVHIANLRRRMGDDANAPRFIDTVRGVGYRVRARA
jgi:DNA-binding response OmpR family regulator